MESEKATQAEREVECATSGDSVENGEVSEPQKNVGTIRKNKWTIVGSIILVSLIVLAIVLGVTLSGNKDEKSTEAEDETTTTEGGSTIPKEKAFAVVDGPVNSTIELLSADIVHGYEDEGELKKGLGEAASFFLGNVLLRNSGDPRFQGVGFGNHNPFNNRFNPELEAAPTADVDTSAGTTITNEKAPDPVGDDVDSYGTNLQEAGVKEGDLVVSDGDFGE